MTRSTDLAVLSRVAEHRQGPFTGTANLCIPGFDFHALRGFKPTRYSVHVNGPWCITFEFEDSDACRIDFEQYH
jgi:hypothetical protein